MSTPTFKSDGSKAVSSAKLDASVFGVSVENHDLLKQVYTAYLSNGRTRNAITLKRGEVSGGGKKPWRQKGTGRARFGSSRNPIWRGGGIAFGPTGDENYIKNVNVKAKRLAIRQALSLSAKAGKVVVTDNFIAMDGKTSAVKKFLSSVGATRRILIIVDTLTDEIVRATNNISNVKLITAKYVNTYDAMNADTIIITSAAHDVLSAWLGDANTTAKKVEA